MFLMVLIDSVFQLIGSLNQQIGEFYVQTPLVKMLTLATEPSSLGEIFMGNGVAGLIGLILFFIAWRLFYSTELK